MIQLRRTTADDPDFVALVKKLDSYLSVTDGDEHAFYNQYNKLDTIKYALVVYVENIAVGCGAIKQFDNTRMEVKRMFVLEDYRGQGIASKILLELESWAQSLAYSACILETGKRQVEAVGLYNKNGYVVIENYGQYQGIENSVCFEKILSK